MPNYIGFLPPSSSTQHTTPLPLATQLNFSRGLLDAYFSNDSGGAVSVIGQALTRSADRHRVNYQSSTSTHLDETHEPIENNSSSAFFYCSAFAFCCKKLHDLYEGSLNPRRYSERLFLDYFSRQQPVTQEPESELNPRNILRSRYVERLFLDYFRQQRVQEPESELSPRNMLHSRDVDRTIWSLFLDYFRQQRVQEPESELNPLSPRQEGEEHQIIINIPPDGRDFDYSSPSPRLRFRGSTPLETNSYIAGHDVVEPETRGRSLRNFVAQQLRRVLGSAEDEMQEERRIV